MPEASMRYRTEHQREANSPLWFQDEKCQGLVGFQAEGKEVPAECKQHIQEHGAGVERQPINQHFPPHALSENPSASSYETICHGGGRGILLSLFEGK